MQGENYLCQKILNKIKATTTWIKENPLHIAGLFFILGIFLFLINLLAIKMIGNLGLFSASGSLFAAAAILYTAYRYQKDSLEKVSKFYLRQVQKYFQDTINILSTASPQNNNISWHQAINALKATENLREKITENSHKEIYLTDYIDTSYSLIQILCSIDSYQFFFGVNPYKNDDESYIHDSTLSLYEDGVNKVSANELCFMGKFIKRASLINEDMRKNKKSLISCLEENYFETIDQSPGCDSFNTFSGGDKITKYYSADLNKMDRKN